MELKYIFTFLLIAYIIMIGVFAVLPTVGKLVPMGPSYDKIYHFVEFFILAFLLVITLSLYSVRNYALITFIIGIIIAIASEIIQLFAANRTFSQYDLLADIAGIVLALFSHWAFLEVFR